MKHLSTSLPRNPVKAHGGFTLIELLTVIAIIGILASILIPTVGKVRNSARKAQCASNQRQIALACLAYADNNKGQLPATNRSVTPEVRWMFQVAPFLARAGGNPNNFSNGRITAIFQCPVDQARVDAFPNNNASNSWDSISYLHMLPVPLTSRENGTEQRNLYQVKDNSQHPMLADAREVASAFYKNNARFAILVSGTSGFIHGDGVNVAYYDGSVKYKTNPTWTSVRGFRD